jgi:protease-4
MKPVRLAALALLCAPAAIAQIRSPTQGVEPPGRSFAVEDEATALTGNPAGLGFSRGVLLEYAGERGFASGLFRSDGAYLSLAGWGVAGGAALEWLHAGSECTPLTPCSRRFSLGGAVRLGWLSMGAGWHTFASSESAALDQLDSWDVGVLLRPTRWLSASYALLDVNSPHLGASRVPRRHTLAVAVRPWEERLTLAADALVRTCVDGVPCGIENPDFRFTAEYEVLRGLRLFAQLGTDPNATSIQAGLQLDLGYFGLRTGPRFHDGDTGFESTVLRLSSIPYPGIRIAPPRAVLLDLDAALRRPPSSVAGLVLGETYRDPLTLTLEKLDRLARDGSIQAVVLRTGGLPLGGGRGDELRRAIQQLRAAGKRVVFYLESAGDLDYSVASAADRVFAAPQAVLAVNGFSATALFAAAGLDKLGVKAEFVRVGAYKNAPDLFTRSDMSREQREVTNAILDDLYGRYLRQVSEERHLDEGRFRRLLDRGLLTPREAQKEGLVDGLAYPDQLEEEVGKLLGAGRVSLEKISVEPPSVRSPRWAPPAVIGVVRVEGDIARGKGGSDPLGAVDVAASEPIVKRIRSLADDEQVRAIVVRIDSPGGDGTASDMIWRELVRARKEKGKPVVASMGDVAASGGYYVAVAADRIFAEPSTITGSIGVFVGKFDLEDLYSTLGLKLVTNKRGKSADLFSTARGLTAEERAMMQGWVDDFYAQFVERVAEGRNLPRERVDALGRGRVWSGQQALDNRLVDSLGGFAEAVDGAKSLAGIAADEQVTLDDPGRGHLSLWPDLQLLPSSLQAIPARTLRALSLLGEPGTVRAVLPFDLEVN